MYTHQKNSISPFIFSVDSKVINHLNDNWQPTQLNTTNTELDAFTMINYNIWFGTRRETLEEYEPRITEVIKVILAESPDFICLQEMTDLILVLFLGNKILF